MVAGKIVCVGKDAPRCTATYGGRTSPGRATLETDELVFRGEFRLVVPRRAITAVRAHDGRLELEFEGGPAVLDLGSAAVRWEQEIQNPKTVIDKLGVKPAQRVAIVGVEDGELTAALANRAELVDGDGPVDHLFVAVEAPPDLDGLAAYVPRIAPAGALWTVRRKGGGDVTEADVLGAGRAAGLVDVKVVRLSDTHSAFKWVIPVSRR
jgi:hypothetical protein